MAATYCYCNIFNSGCICSVLDDFGGSGNSLHGVGGRANKRAQMRRCLRLIRSMVSTMEENVLQDLSDQGAINQLTSMLADTITTVKPVFRGHSNERTPCDQGTFSHNRSYLKTDFTVQ